MTLQVTVIDRQRARRVPRAALAAWVRRAAAAAPRARGDVVTILLCGDAAMRRLNARWRGKDRTTDVLSFPSDGEVLPDGTRPAGELAICVPQAARQAKAAGHPLRRELEILALHGYLHLLGYDHEVDGGTMMRLQARLARRLAAGR